MRTPLALIRSTAELALRRERDSEEYRKALSEIEHEADRMTELATLSVRDSGEGIPPGALPHIFERFYRAKESRGGKGVGLGLSIAQAIAQAHGSEIEVESRPGEGACFGLALRAAAPKDSR